MRAQSALIVVIATLCVAPGAGAQSEALRPAPSLALAEWGCAPRPAADLDDAVHVVGGLDGQPRSLLAPGEHIVVDGGSDRGLKAGAVYFVRRPNEPTLRGEGVPTTDTAGWVTVESVQATTASARVLWACDGIAAGDALVPFEGNLPPAPAPAGRPVFDTTGVVLAGIDARTTGAAHDRMLVDIGAAAPLSAGQRVTFFRRPYATSAEPGPVLLVGEGHVLETWANAAIVQIDASRFPVTQGDRVAPHR